MNSKYQGIAGKITRGLEPYVNKYRLPLILKANAIQRMEMEGKIPFETENFHNEYYMNHIKRLTPLQNQFL